MVAAPAPTYVPPPALAAIPPGATPVFVTTDKKMQFGSLTITPGGFVALEGLYRTRTENADIASSFANVPFGPQAAATTVNVGALNNSGIVSVVGSSATTSPPQATLNVAGAAGFGTAGSVTTEDNASLQFASGSLSTIASGASLSLDGTQANIGIAGSTTHNAALSGLSENDGSLTLADNSLSTSASTFTNKGTLYVESNEFHSTTTPYTPGSLSVAGNFMNDGNIYAGNFGIGGGNISVGGAFTNNGYINIEGGSVSAASYKDSASFNEITFGTSSNGASVLALNGGTAVVNSGATLKSSNVTLGGNAHLEIAAASSNVTSPFSFANSATRRRPPKVWRRRRLLSPRPGPRVRLMSPNNSPADALRPAGVVRPGVPRPVGWLTRLANPATFLRFTALALPWFAGATALLFAVGLGLAAMSPPDYQQGFTVLIMYLHVPAAWLAMMVYVVMTASALGTVVWRHPLADAAQKAAAPLGAGFTLICLVTGSLWGKPMWGTWWVWDARLTSVLILFLIYLGLVAIWQVFEDQGRAAKAAAIFTLTAVVIIPIIHFSVVWWNTLHQPASVFRMGGPSVAASMLRPLLTMALAFTLLFFTLHLMAVRNEILRRRLRRLVILQASDEER